MVRSRLTEDEYKKLKKIGFELRPPVDEYSEQPSSGGVIGGRRGAQEYGIQGGPAQEDAHDRDFASNVDINSADIELEGSRFPQEVVDRNFPGLSQYTSAHMSGSEGLEATREGRGVSSEDETDSELPNQAELEMLLRQRLSAHPELKRERIQVSFEADGRLRLSGVVHSEAARMDAQELSEAVIGHNDIENRLEVSP